MNAFMVGEYAFLMVGIGGTVDEVGDDFVVIEGVRLPRSLKPGAPVRYLSTELPPDPTDTSPCGECAAVEVEAAKYESRWQDLVQREHDQRHDGPLWMCPNDLCRESTSMYTSSFVGADA